MAFHEGVLDALEAQPPLVRTAVQVAVVAVAGYVVLWLLRTYAVELMGRSRRVDKTLATFLRVLITSGGWVVLVVVILAAAGVDLTALVGGLAVGGFILGFALKDTLGNLAAGVMLLFYRPFHVGEVVTISGESGSVGSLGIAMTTLMTADGRIITMPNGSVLGGTIINHTRSATRSADVIVGIRYEDDIDTAMQAIHAALREDPRVLPEPAPIVRIQRLGESSVDLLVRPWVATEGFWQTHAEIHGVVKRAVEGAGCQIPFPQRDVHLFHAAGGPGAGPDSDAPPPVQAPPKDPRAPDPTGPGPGGAPGEG